eukprot:755896-Hanusia_phi.AAC.1
MHAGLGDGGDSLVLELRGGVRREGWDGEGQEERDRDRDRREERGERRTASITLSWDAIHLVAISIDAVPAVVG